LQGRHRGIPAALLIPFAASVILVIVTLAKRSKLNGLKPLVTTPSAAANPNNATYAASSPTPNATQAPLTHIGVGAEQQLRGHRNFYDLLNDEPATETKREAYAKLKGMEMSRRPRLSAFLGNIVSCCVALLLFIIALMSLRSAGNSQMKAFGAGFAILLFWIFAFQLYRVIASQCMRYTISRGYLLIQQGVIARKYPIYELLHLKDSAEIRQGFLERLTGNGTLILQFEQHPRPITLVGVAPFEDLMQFRGNLLDLARLLRGVTGLIA